MAIPSRTYCNTYAYIFGEVCVAMCHISMSHVSKTVSFFDALRRRIHRLSHYLTIEYVEKADFVC